MSHLPIPLSVLYAGLAGTVLALIVATICNRWSPRVFFLLALRLAIGWHFLFEGLHKVESYYNGPTETSKPFSSEIYFKVAPGPLGEKMRKEFSDPDAEIASKVQAPEKITPAAFARLKEADQAAKCPAAVAAQFDALQTNVVDALQAEAEKQTQKAGADEARAVEDASDAEQRALKGQWTPEEVKEILLKADDAHTKARTEAEGRRAQIRDGWLGMRNSVRT